MRSSLNKLIIYFLIFIVLNAFMLILNKSLIIRFLTQMQKKEDYVLYYSHYDNYNIYNYSITKFSTPSVGCSSSNIHVNIIAKSVPLGSLSKINISLSSSSLCKNIVIYLQSSCPSYIQAISINSPAYILGNRIILRSLTPGKKVSIVYKYLPEMGSYCILLLNIEKDRSTIKSVSKLIRTTGYVKVISTNRVYSDEEVDMKYLLGVIFAVLLIFTKK